jgi:hypothetical protein
LPAVLAQNVHAARDHYVRFVAARLQLGRAAQGATNDVAADDSREQLEDDRVVTRATCERVEEESRLARAGSACPRPSRVAGTIPACGLSASRDHVSAQVILHRSAGNPPSGANVQVVVSCVV